MMSLQGNLTYLGMMLRSDHKAEKYYEYLRQVPILDTPDGIPMINMGYWRGVSVDAPEGLWEASLKLCRLVGETAELGPGDDVLDAGCGYGTNAIHSMDMFGPRRIVALNTAGAQIEHGRRLLAASRWGERIAFQHGSATHIAQRDGTFDKVISIEAAFHFPPRSAFFREARRVLRPGGLLTIADLISVPPQNALQRVQLGFIRRALQIPAQNVYGLDRYREELEDAGFVVEHIASIREHVLPQYQRWLFKHKGPRWRELHLLFAAANASLFLYPWDYAVIRARKASRTPRPRREQPAPRCPYHARGPTDGHQPALPDPSRGGLNDA